MPEQAYKRLPPRFLPATATLVVLAFTGAQANAKTSDDLSASRALAAAEKREKRWTNVEGCKRESRRSFKCRVRVTIEWELESENGEPPVNLGVESFVCLNRVFLSGHGAVQVVDLRCL